MTYFMAKLRKCAATNTRMSKSEKDKEDLTIFSVLLLVSRLIPYSFYAEDEADTETREAFRLKHNIDERLAELISLIKHYSSSSTYFVRKISA